MVQRSNMHALGYEVSVATYELNYYELLEAFYPLRMYHAVYKQYVFRFVEARLDTSNHE